MWNFKRRGTDLWFILFREGWEFPHQNLSVGTRKEETRRARRRRGKCSAFLHDREFWRFLNVSCDSALCWPNLCGQQCQTHGSNENGNCARRSQVQGCYDRFVFEWIPHWLINDVDIWASLCRNESWSTMGISHSSFEQGRRGPCRLQHKRFWSNNTRTVDQWSPRKKAIPIVACGATRLTGRRESTTDDEFRAVCESFGVDYF